MPLRDAVEYVAAAYIVVFVLVAVYLAIMAARLRKVEQGLSEMLAAAAEGDRASGPEGHRRPAPDDDRPSGSEEHRRPSPEDEQTSSQEAQEPPCLDVGRPESSVA